MLGIEPRYFHSVILSMKFRFCLKFHNKLMILKLLKSLNFFSSKIFQEFFLIYHEILCDRPSLTFFINTPKTNTKTLFGS